MIESAVVQLSQEWVRDKRLVGGEIGRSRKRHALVAPAVLADAIEHHHGVVHRIAGKGEKRRHGGQREIEIRSREYNPAVTNTSWPVATIAATPYCHSKRTAT